MTEEPRAAPRWRRVLAGLLDTAILTAVYSLGVFGAVRRMRASAPARTAPGRLAGAATFAMAALRARGDSPGLRLLRLERRDRLSGRRPGTLRAIAAVALSQLPRIAASRATASARARAAGPRAAAVQARQVALRNLRAEHAADPDAFQRAARELAPPTVASWRILGAYLLISAVLRRVLAPLRRRVAGDPVTVVIG